MRPLREALAILAWGAGASVAGAQHVYFAETDFGTGWVKRVSADGSGLDTLAETSGGIRGVEVATDLQFLYWSNVDTGSILRAPISTPDLWEPVVTGLSFPSDISLDESHDLLAWVDESTGTVSVSDLDGSGRRDIVTDVLSVAIDLDTDREHVYFEDRASISRGAIRRIGLDGSGVETVIADVPTATDLAVDPEHGYIYWGSSAGFDNTGGIYRVRFDGTGFEEIFKPDTPLSDATALTIDSQSGAIYFGVRSNADVTDIYRMGLDGSDPQVIASGFQLIPHMTFLVPSPSGLAALATAALLGCRRCR
ncbi:MAG TPA: hypothetical protein VFF69_12990 [Phycisphaerales bacterium]|nr:hypothetical protein [Phycisphaerales bacterium]